MSRNAADLTFRDAPASLQDMIATAADLCDGIPVEQFDSNEYVRGQVELIYDLQNQPWHKAQGLDGDVVRKWIRDAIQDRMIAKLKVVK